MNQIWIYAACTLCIGVHAKALHLKLFFICRILVRLVWPCLWNEPFNSWSRFIWFLFYAWWLILFCLFSHSLILSFLIHPKKKKSVFLFFLSISSNSSLCVYELIWMRVCYFIVFFLLADWYECVCIFLCFSCVSNILSWTFFIFFSNPPSQIQHGISVGNLFCLTTPLFLFPVCAILADVGHLVCVYVLDLVLALLAFTFHLPLLLPSPHLSLWQLCFHHHLSSYCSTSCRFLCYYFVFSIHLSSSVSFSHFSLSLSLSLYLSISLSFLPDVPNLLHMYHHFIRSCHCIQTSSRIFVKRMSNHNPFLYLFISLPSSFSSLLFSPSFSSLHPCTFTLPTQS